MTKTFRLFFLLLVPLRLLTAEPVVSTHTKQLKEYEILERFLKMQVDEEGYDYVLKGVKPISIRDFYTFDQFPIAKDLQHAEQEFVRSLLVREALSIWKRLCSDQKNFVLKAAPLAYGWEVSFINIAKLKETINHNIDLFRYVLGPAIQTEQLVHDIAYSDQPLSHVLKNDCVLIGIVLGFGAHNSLIGGRLDTLFIRSISKDCPPFAGKSTLMQRDKNIFSPERFGLHYLDFAGGDDSFFKNNSSDFPLQPSVGFTSVEEEYLTLHTLDQPLPASLTKSPQFIFGAFRGDSSNEPLFTQLVQVQKQTQTLLKKPDFLNQILTKINGKKTSIPHNHLSDSSSFLLDAISTAEWIEIIQNVAKHFDDKEERLTFVKSFCEPARASREPPPLIGVSKATLKGLNKALHNLALANAHFEELSKEASLKELAPKQLYCKTTTSTSGKTLKGTGPIRLGYTIEDLEKNVLFANHDTWLNLSEVIAGLAHGVQGMRTGEKRTLFVHPSLAFGALTTLPPCTELIIHVHLIDIEEKAAPAQSLPLLTPLDSTWLEDPALARAIEQSIAQKPRFIASFYRDLIDKLEKVDKAAISEQLQKFF
jgi:hypothetical protein